MSNYGGMNGMNGGMNGANMQALMKQAQALQKEVLKAQEEFEQTVIEGVAANGYVKIVMNGRYDISSVKINPRIVNASDTEMLEDLIAVAFRNANEKIIQLRKEKLGKFKGMF